MAQLQVKTVEGVTLSLDLAGPGTRFAAGIFDGALLTGLILGAYLILENLGGVDPTGASVFLQGFLALGALLVVVLYHVLYHWRSEGITPGKRVMGIRVVALDGRPAGLAALILRGTLFLVDVLLALPLPVGLVVIALSAKRQRLGDLVAGTLVIRDPRARRGPPEPWSKETWQDLQVRVLDLGPAAASRFGVQDLTFLRSVIMRRGIEPMIRRQLLIDVAAHYRQRLGVAREEDPRAVIKELYLFLRENRQALGV